MPFDPETCEPLRVWDRLEPRARQVEFDRVLRARVHDPLWMLTRQWQFGEFKGEDTGSAVLATLARRIAPLTAVRAGAGAWEPSDDGLPLEAHVERLPLRLAPPARAALGRQFLIRLAHNATQLPAGAAPFDPAHYRTALRTHFGFTVPPLDPADPADATAIARRRSDAAAHRMLLALAGRAVDGVALFAALRPGTTWNDLPGTLALQVDPDHADLVLETLEQYRVWFAGHYAAPPGAVSAWEPAQLEYQFACAYTRSGDTVVVSADEYDSGRLDWHSFDLAPSGPAGAGAAAAETEVRTVIPAPVEFAGMPNPRWWQFEDGAVELGDIRADSTDLAKLVVAEFALLYGNNWLVIPCTQQVGTLAEVDGIVVTDVFGWRTLVRAATGSSGGVWTRWDMFSLSTPGAAPLGQHLLLPPTLAGAAESAPVESVAFVRDESSNTVWAVERRIPDGLGGGRDGAAAGQAFRAALADLVTPEPATNTPVAALRYRLGTTVPEHWIPFVPVRRPGSDREIRLQRGSMPRFLDGQAQRVRPLTATLRPGLRDDDTQAAPYLLNEEEVPRHGTVIDTTFQRARWFDGTTVVWQGRRRRSGAGEGGSGLRFDTTAADR
jgi:hypothetical protein